MGSAVKLNKIRAKQAVEDACDALLQKVVLEYFNSGEADDAAVKLLVFGIARAEAKREKAISFLEITK